MNPLNFILILIWSNMKQYQIPGPATLEVFFRECFPGKPFLQKCSLWKTKPTTCLFKRNERFGLPWNHLYIPTHSFHHKIAVVWLYISISSMLISKTTIQLTVIQVWCKLKKTLNIVWAWKSPYSKRGSLWIKAFSYVVWYFIYTPVAII